MFPKNSNTVQNSLLSIHAIALCFLSNMHTIGSLAFMGWCGLMWTDTIAIQPAMYIWSIIIFHVFMVMIIWVWHDHFVRNYNPSGPSDGVEEHVTDIDLMRSRNPHICAIVGTLILLVHGLSFILLYQKSFKMTGGAGFLDESALVATNPFFDVWINVLVISFIVNLSVFIENVYTIHIYGYRFWGFSRKEKK